MKSIFDEFTSIKIKMLFYDISSLLEHLFET